MSDKILTIDELAKMQEKVIDATKSDAPVAIETPTTSIVNGDPTKVQSIDPKNYTVELWLPVTSAKPATAERVMDGTAYKQFVKIRHTHVNGVCLYFFTSQSHHLQ